eukprot:6356057-Amphidinium_carterae.1
MALSLALAVTGIVAKPSFTNSTTKSVLLRTMLSGSQKDCIAVAGVAVSAVTAAAATAAASTVVVAGALYCLPPKLVIIDISSERKRDSRVDPQANSSSGGPGWCFTTRATNEALLAPLELQSRLQRQPVSLPACLFSTFSPCLMLTWRQHGVCHFGVSLRSVRSSDQDGAGSIPRLAITICLSGFLTPAAGSM